MNWLNPFTFEKSQCWLSFLGLVVVNGLVIAQEEPPRSLDPRLKIELFAENPQIVTPTGIDVDHAGRVWAIESNTHFPPEGYNGHPTDRVLVMEDTDGDRKADKITVFKDGLTHTMSIAVKPVWLDIGRETRDASREPDKKDGKALPLAVDSRLSTLDVFIATRREILLCTDTDGDLKCDETKQLVHLETKGNYPHNGLAGFAFDALGNMFFGFGENLGADYKIIGSDGTTLSGGGEGGNIYRCKPDGSKLERWATGFWNPHASCFDAFGRMFTLDNDPDSRPPCRLLHIIQGGDYGYKFRNGRKGTHPFTSWNGEIPGTLPMVSGTGEAPSGIVAYESDGFPEDYLGTLLVGSWGDHRIDKFILKPRGFSFESLPQPVIKGGENFRPVGLALAPDGSLFVTDWVLKDYKLHGKGRVWRVSATEEPKREVPRILDIRSETSIPKLAELVKSRSLVVRRTAARRIESLQKDVNLIRELSSEYSELARTLIELEWIDLKSNTTERLTSTEQKHDAFQLSKTVDAVARPQASNEMVRSSATRDLTREANINLPVHVRRFAPFVGLLAARRRFPTDHSLALLGLTHSLPEIRRLAVQWVGEENLKELRPEVEKVLASEPMTGDLFMACLASLSMLDGVPPSEFEKAPPVQHVLPIVRDAKRSASLRAIALRMLPASMKELDAKLFVELMIDKGDAPAGSPAAQGKHELRREAVRTLAQSPIPERETLLRTIAVDESLDVNLRADAVAGLAPIDQRAKLNEATRDLLLKLVNGKETSLAIEALRSLRSVATAKPDEAAHDTTVADAVKALDFEMSKREPSESRIPLAEAAAFATGNRRVGLAYQKPSVEELVGKAHPTGNAEAGRRVFFHTNGAGCFRCHTVGGRGGAVGPDLTVIARTMDRQKLAESILEPSKEISPQFTTWAIETKAGKVLTGMLLGEEVNGDLRLGDNTGKVFFVPFNDIETRQPLKTSIMPEKLHEQMTPSEFRDLISYLETLK